MILSIKAMTRMENKNLLNRITRDINEGIIVLDLHGNITFINPAAEKLLEIGKIKEKDNYAKIMEDDIKKENDDFFQFLINAAYEKDKVHTGEIRFVTRKNNKKFFKMTSSFLFSEDKKQKEGVVIQFSDVTEVHTLQQKSKDYAYVFVLLMASESLWCFVSSIWASTGQLVSSLVMTKIVEGFGFVAFFILWKFTSITLKDMGLSLKNSRKYILTDIKYTILGALFLILIKFILLKTKPDLFIKQSIFNFDLWDWSCTIYPISVIAQEFLTRGVFHESVKRTLTGKNATLWAIIVSSFFFATLHIHKGALYMLGAFLLLSVFGLVYEKQGTIWGLCIPHYVLGMMVNVIFEII